MVEKLFFQSAEFCSEHEVGVAGWNVANKSEVRDLLLTGRLMHIRVRCLSLTLAVLFTFRKVWKLNVAHVFFMQETKFKDAIR